MCFVNKQSEGRAPPFRVKKRSCNLCASEPTEWETLGSCCVLEHSSLSLLQIIDFNTLY